MSPEPSESIQSGWSEAQIRRLKYAVVILGVLIVVGLFALIAGLSIKASRIAASKPSDAARPAASNEPAEIVLPFAAGGELKSFLIADGVLVMHIKSERGHSLALYDVKTGRLLRTLTVPSR
jgi:hypothetical protein